ncbi:unnamed protein product [Caenorhabditis auriculariae]|uniref:Uncharacterized protein n=1 Tax=Caenorhabditis auriculariae TaxID=2777116 RepID=A0A8S1HFM4_9PELO|nr:unnamed protein product [Caenorhabditis auriculariae]
MDCPCDGFGRVSYQRICQSLTSSGRPSKFKTFELPVLQRPQRLMTYRRSSGLMFVVMTVTVGDDGLGCFNPNWNEEPFVRETFRRHVLRAILMKKEGDDGQFSNEDSWS